MKKEGTAVAMPSYRIELLGYFAAAVLLPWFSMAWPMASPSASKPTAAFSMTVAWFCPKTLNETSALPTSTTKAAAAV
jgi:hypothetical protein